MKNVKTYLTMNKNLAVSYIVFDDVIEHLESSINCIRNDVDYISCVYQHVSFHGTPGRDSNYEILDNLYKRGLLDFIIYTNNDFSLTGHQNTIRHRNLGLQDAIDKNFGYFLSIDGDEYYVKDEFKKTKDLIIDRGFESSACQMITYYKYLNLILDPPEDYYCPFIYKINKNYRFGQSTDFPVGISLDRLYHSNNFIKLDRSQIQMHHMSSVRSNLKVKLENHICTSQFKNEINYLVDYYNNYKYPDKILFQAHPVKWYDAKLIDSIFENPNFQFLKNY